jgi:hypothetical protein
MSNRSFVPIVRDRTGASIFVERGPAAGNLPTPHGGACKPWRELTPMPREDSRLPADDVLLRRGRDE